MKLEKLARLFQKPLSEEELANRCQETHDVLVQLQGQPPWEGWIEGACLFGSTATGEARTGSDVDVAILTQEQYTDPGALRESTSGLKMAIEERLALAGADFKVDVIVVSESWLTDPTGSLVRQDVLDHLYNAGKQIL